MPSVFPESVRPVDILGDAMLDAGQLGNTPMLKALLRGSQAALDTDFERTRASLELGFGIGPTIHNLLGPETARQSLEAFAPSLLPGGTVGELLLDMTEVPDAVG